MWNNTPNKDHCAQRKLYMKGMYKLVGDKIFYFIQLARLILPPFPFTYNIA